VKGVVLMKRKVSLVIVSLLIVVTLTGCSIFDNYYNRDLFPSITIGNGNHPGNDTTYPTDNGYENQLPHYDWGKLDLKIIDSIDKLNYYSAIRVLEEENSRKSVAFTNSDNKIIPLTTYAEDEEILPDSTDNSEGSDDSLNDQTQDIPSGVVFYALSPNDVFSFEKVSRFTVELTDENGFLASKLVLGTVEVIISENCIWEDSLITFRNGDKFYSCLSNGYSYNRNTGGHTWQFSTHKFVDGFYIVKSIEQENYAFDVEMDFKGQVTSFVCQEFKLGGENVDENVIVMSATEISTDGAAYTVADLDAYFRAKNEKEDNENNEELSSEKSL
jgi:hypothetical protein